MNYADIKRIDVAIIIVKDALMNVPGILTMEINLQKSKKKKCYKI